MLIPYSALVLLLLLLGVGGGLTGPITPLQTGRLSGVIVDTATGAPIPSARVEVRAMLAPTTPTLATTDAAGRYVITRLTAGIYTVTASAPTYVTATFGRLHTVDVGGTIALAEGQNRSRVDFQLSRAASLSGRVVGVDGKGLAGLLVKASRPHTVDGRKRLVTFGSTRSDANGAYRVDDLLPGDYYLSVALYEPGDSRNAKYAPTFYPASADIATARRIYVRAGATTRIDHVTPLRVPWTRLLGRVKSVDGNALMRGAVVLQPGDPEGLSFSPDAVTELFPDGRFSIEFVVPGRYIVRAIGNTGTDETNLFASWSVDVAGAPIPDHTMTLKPGADWSGVVQFDARDSHVAQDVTLIQIHAPLLDGSGFVAESTTRPQADGRFRLSSVDSGSTLIRVGGLVAPWSLDSVMQHGRDITDVPLDVVQGQKIQDVRITLTDVVTGVTGRVQNAAGEPVVNYLVIAFPVDRSYWRPFSRHIRAVRTDWEGHYRLATLPPGEYRLAAVTDFEEGEIYERDTLDQIGPRSTPATLVSGIVGIHNLTVTVGQRSGGG